MHNFLRAEVVEGKSEFAEIKLDTVLAEDHVSLHVVPQVTSQQQVHHHEHVLLVLRHRRGGNTTGLQDLDTVCILRKVTFGIKQSVLGHQKYVSVQSALQAPTE